MEPPPRPASAIASPAGRDAELARLEQALAQGEPGAVVLEGPSGSGMTTLLAHVARRAAELGREVHQWPFGGPPPGWSANGAAAPVLCVDEAVAFDASALGALPPGALVVLALSSGAPLSDPTALAALRARPTTSVLGLGPLTPAAVRGLVRRALGTRDDEALSAACSALTGGNPELLVRVLAVLAAQPAVPKVELLDDLLAGILDDVAARWEGVLQRLGPTCTALADAAVILADPIPLWIAAEVADLRAGPAAEAADTLVRAGMLTTADPLRITAPLVRRALAGRAPSARANERRRRAARLLGQTVEGLADAADHLLALPPGGEPWAVELLDAEAARATADGEHGRAAACLERALAEPLALPARSALLVRLGRAHENAGSDGAVAAYQQALLAAEPAERARIHLLLGRARFGSGDYRGSALELERGLAAAGPGEIDVTGELVAAYVAAARFDRTLADPAARHLAPLLEAGVPGRTVAERALLAEIALEQGIRGAPSATVIGLAQRAWADGLLLEGADQYGIAVSQVAAALTWSDAFEPSIAVLTATFERAERDGSELVSATARYLRAWPRWYLGDLDGAEVDARAALEAEGWHMYEASARAILGHILIDRGELEAARAALALSDLGPWERTVPYAMLLETRSRLHVRDGDLEAARLDLEQAGSLLASMGNESPFCPWRSRLGLVVDRLGEPARGLALVEEELAQAERITLPRARGIALHRRTLLTGADAETLTLACELLRGCGACLELARALTTLGCSLAAQGDPPAARTALHEALEIAERLGAADLAAAAGRELRRAGGRPSRVPTASGITRLTASELRVARLAAHGATNRAIADELVVTPHTVRFHLANVYRKLSVAGRDELGAALKRLR